jgi:hypothetical protein
VIARRLGHKNTDVLESIYGHRVKDDATTAREVMTSMWAEANTEREQERTRVVPIRKAESS